MARDLRQGPQAPRSQIREPHRAVGGRLRRIPPDAARKRHPLQRPGDDGCLSRRRSGQDPGGRQDHRRQGTPEHPRPHRHELDARREGKGLSLRERHDALQPAHGRHDLPQVRFRQTPRLPMGGVCAARAPRHALLGCRTRHHAALYRHPAQDHQLGESQDGGGLLPRRRDRSRYRQDHRDHRGKGPHRRQVQFQPGR